MISRFRWDVFGGAHENKNILRSIPIRCDQARTRNKKNCGGFNKLLCQPLPFLCLQLPNREPNYILIRSKADADSRWGQEVKTFSADSTVRNSNMPLLRTGFVLFDGDKTANGIQGLPTQKSQKDSDQITLSQS